MNDISNFLVDTSSIINNQAGLPSKLPQTTTPTKPSKLERQPLQDVLHSVRTRGEAPIKKNPLSEIIDHFGLSQKVADETVSLNTVSNVEAAKNSLIGWGDKASELDVTRLGMPVFNDPADPETVEMSIADVKPATVENVAPVAPKALTKEDRVSKIVYKSYEYYQQTGDIHKAEEHLGKSLREYETKHLHGGELVVGHGFDDTTVKIVQNLSQEQSPRNAKDAKFWGQISEKFNPEVHPNVLCNNTKRFEGVRAKARSLGKSENLKQMFMNMYEELHKGTRLFSSRDQGYIALAKRYYSIPKRI